MGKRCFAALSMTVLRKHDNADLLLSYRWKEKLVRVGEERPMPTRA